MMAVPGEANINSMPAFGLPKINSLGGRHFQPHLSGFAAVIDQREQRHPLDLRMVVSVECLVHGVGSQF